MDQIVQVTIKQLNDPKHTGSIINFTIQELINQAYETIKQKQLVTHSPEFLHHDQMNLLNEFIFQSTPNFGVEKPNGIFQEDCKSIIKIQKDNLSPKQLPSEYNQKQAVKKLPQSISQYGSKRLGMTNRSSFLKRKSSIISHISSSMATQRRTTNKLQHSIQQSKKINRSNSTKKKDPLQNFTSLIVPQQQDEYVKHLREKVEFHYKEKQKQLKIITARLNEDKQKREQFQIKYGDKNQYTFDFEGQTLGMQVSKQQKLNYYAMKYGMKTLSKKFKEMYKNVQNQKNQNQKSQEILSKNKGFKPKENSNTIELKSSSQIPMPDRQHRSFFVQTDPAKLKIKQYKRLYGKKFSRYDNYSMTIDLSSLNQKKHTQEDYFSSKKHFKDNQLIKSRKSSISKDYVQNRLALPKLQGKYKVLDRYQQI